MRYESHNYFHHVQRQFCLHFDESYDAKRGEMRDSNGTVIRTEGHVSHTVDTGLEGANVARLHLYSYRALVGRMWRVKVGEGIRIFGWQNHGKFSITTTRHMTGMARASNFSLDFMGGIDVFCPPVSGAWKSIEYLPPDIEVILDAYVEAVGQRNVFGLIPPTRAGLRFASNELGMQRIRIWREDDPSIFREYDIDKMASDRAIMYVNPWELGLTHHRKPATVRRTFSTHGELVNSRGKVVARWQCIPSHPQHIEETNRE